VSRSVVIGGGVSGLACAFALAQKGDEVRVLESSARPGGVVRTERQEGYLLELGPNTVRPTPELWSLIEEIGLAGSAVLAPRDLPRFIEFDGKLHGLAPGPGTLFSTRLLSAAGKLRLLGEPFVGRSADPRESVDEFFARRLGPEVAERLVGPFVSGIWAGDARALSAAASFPVLARWEREHGSLLRGALASRPPRGTPRSSTPKGLLSFRDGLETLPRTLAERLGERLSLNAPVAALRREGGRFRLETSGGLLEAERVVLAAPAGEAARILKPLAPEAARSLSEVPQPPLTVLHLSWPEAAFASPLRGFGHLVVPEPGRRILGAVWSSCLFSGRAPQGQVLITAFVGGARDPEAAALPEGALLDLAAREVSASLGAMSAPRLVRATRYSRAIPQYDRDHESRMSLLAQAEASLPGLTLIGNYRGGISVGDVVKNALSVARGLP
jgi:oxygen-dependent protoporphyrinogen oxidase